MWSQELDPTLEYRAALQLEPIAGRSAALAGMFRRLRNAAALDGLHVLLTGETGTGKSLVARVIHENSPRARGPFVEVNCAAIPRELWEAEFFGCARNAYTQATERAGRFASADGGTLFLDEIGELAPDLQAKLLRVLDQGCFERLGEDRTRRANVRIIAATNRPLESDMSTGRFRPDLFFRLSRYQIRVPSLAERREDIGLLAALFVDRECKELGLPASSLDPAVLGALSARAWPGNVRQLQSVIAQAVIEASASDASEVGWEHFAPDAGALLLAAEPAPLSAGTAPVSVVPVSVPLASPPPVQRFAEATRDFQRQLVASAVEAEHGNVTRAARRLGLSRSHVYTCLAGGRGGLPLSEKAH
jgi:anaerobic nitric oxide reductase transcription regulator